MYDILIEFGDPRMLVGLFKTCLDGTQSKLRIGNHLYSSFLIEDGLEQGDDFIPLLFNITLEYVIRKV